MDRIAGATFDELTFSSTSLLRATSELETITTYQSEPLEPANGINCRYIRKLHNILFVCPELMLLFLLMTLEIENEYQLARKHDLLPRLLNISTRIEVLVYYVVRYYLYLNCLVSRSIQLCDFGRSLAAE